MTQWRVLCPHNRLLKTATTAGDIRELSSPRLVQSTSWLVRELSSPLVDQSTRCPVSELAIRELAYPRVVQLPFRDCAKSDHREVSLSTVPGPSRQVLFTLPLLERRNEQYCLDFAVHASVIKDKPRHSAEHR